MELPEEIPESLVRRAVPIEAAGPGDAAWTRDDALEVVESLRGTKVAIVGGDVYLSDRLGLVPANENWACDPRPGETATDYAERSRDMASGRIKAPTVRAPDDLYYGLTFSDQQRAA